MQSLPKKVAATDPSSLILNSPVAFALTVVGDRWAALILRDVFLGVRRFEDLRRRSGAARGTLTSRLKSLVEHEILYREAYQQSPPRFEYRLTPRGLDLYPYMLAVWDWETTWGGENQIPLQLTHSRCQQIMRPVFRCQQCKLPVVAKDVRFEPMPNPPPVGNMPARFQRRSQSRVDSAAGVDRRFFHVLDIVGDRWTGLVVASLYFGLNRYDEIAAALGIATNILSDRLKSLLAADVVQRVAYRELPTRYEYRLTAKGLDLYNNVLQMHEWASRWLLDTGGSTVLLRHKPCAALLHSEMVCSECTEPLLVTDVRFEPGDVEIG